MRRTAIARKSGVAWLRRDPPKKTGPSSDVVMAVLDRAGCSCEVCGAMVHAERGVDWSIHHRRPRQMGGSRWGGINLSSNLMLVCGSGTSLCHGVVESERAAAIAAGWLVQSRTDPRTVAVLIGRDRWCYLGDDGRYHDSPQVAS